MNERPSSGCSTSAKVPRGLPVLVGGVLVRLAQRHADQPGLLRLAPGHDVVGELADERAARPRACGAAARRPTPLPGISRAPTSAGGLAVAEVAGHAVALEERHEVGPVARPEQRHGEPAAVLGLRRSIGASDTVSAGVAAGLAVAAAPGA